MTWIVRNLQNMDDSTFGSKPTKHLYLDDSDLDLVYNNDDNGTNSVISYVENVKISKKKTNKLNRNDLIILLNYIASKL